MTASSARTDIQRALLLFFLLERCVAGFLHWALRDKGEKRFDNKLSEFLKSRKSVQSIPDFTDEPDANEKPVLVTDLENYLAKAAPYSPNPDAVFGRPITETEQLFGIVRKLRRQRNKVMHGMIPENDPIETARDMACLFRALHSALRDRLSDLGLSNESTWTRMLFLSAAELLYIADGHGLPRDTLKITFDGGTRIEYLNLTDHRLPGARKIATARRPEGHWRLWVSGTMTPTSQLEGMLGRAQLQLRGRVDAAKAVTGYLPTGPVYGNRDPFGIPVWRTASSGHGFLCAWLPGPTDPRNEI